MFESSSSFKRNKKQFKEGVAKKETEDYTAVLYTPQLLFLSLTITVFTAQVSVFFARYIYFKMCENSLRFVYLKIKLEWRQELHFHQLQDILHSREFISTSLPPPPPKKKDKRFSLLKCTLRLKSCFLFIFIQTFKTTKVWCKILGMAKQKLQLILAKTN